MRSFLLALRSRWVLLPRLQRYITVKRAISSCTTAMARLRASSLCGRITVGVGLTWASPFGALTVDYAVPITKAAYDVVQPFNFSAGGF